MEGWTVGLPLIGGKRGVLKKNEAVTIEQRDTLRDKGDEKRELSLFFSVADGFHSHSD